MNTNPLYKRGQVVHVGEIITEKSLAYTENWKKYYNRELIINGFEFIKTRNSWIYWLKYDKGCTGWGIFEEDILENQRVLTEEDMM